MQRSTVALRVVLVSAGLSLLASACGGTPEEPILRGYFQASRLRDRTTLGNIATVAFEPTRDGQVERFDVASVGPEQSQPLHLREYAKAHQDATAASQEFGKKMKAYQDENLEVIDRVLKAERSKARLSPKDQEVQKAWTQFRDETAQYQKRASEARSKLSQERGLAELSVSLGGRTVDVTNYEGVLVTKDVTVNARVRTPDGQVAEKQLVVTLSQARLKDEKGQDLTGRWLVTRIQGS